MRQRHAISALHGRRAIVTTTAERNSQSRGSLGRGGSLTNQRCSERLPTYEVSAQHSECVHVRLEDRLVLAAFVGVLLAQAHDGAQCLGVEPVGLRLRVDVAHVVGEGFLFLLEPLDALDEGLEMILGETSGRLFLHGGGSGHRALLTDGVEALIVAQVSRAALTKSSHDAGHPQECTGKKINACVRPVRMPPAALSRLPSDASPSTRRTACRRPPRGSRPCSSPRLLHRPRSSSNWTGSCGRTRRGSSSRCSAPRCGRAGARLGAGTRRPRARCGSCRRESFGTSFTIAGSKIWTPAARCYSQKGSPPPLRHERRRARLGIRYASVFLTRSADIGRCRNRLPVSWNMALAMAGATVTTPISPIPVGGLSVVMIRVWICGTSLIRSTG